MFSILRWLHHHSGGHAQFMRYCLLGAMNTALDFTIYTGLTRGWNLWSRHYLAANAVSFMVVVTWSFFWNKYWTFKNRQGNHAAQYARFVLATLGGISISQTALFIGVNVFGLYDLIAKVTAAPLVVLWNFFMYRRWAFQEKPLPIAYGISRK